MKILLMGFMGCGKSTIGKLISAKHSMDYIDLDEWIEKKEKKSIAEIFERKGEIYFRKAERKYLKKILKKDNIVIAAGGGTPCYSNNINLINENAVSFYLKVPAVKLYERLSQKKFLENRPLLKNFSTKKELLNFIKTKKTEREKFYLMADYTIRTVEMDEQEIAAEIISYVR